MAQVGSDSTSAVAAGRSAVTRFVDRLFAPVDASSLGAFRALFGVVMFWEVLRYFAEGRIRRYYLEPRFLFTYELFPFVAPWPGELLYAHFAVMGVAALGIALGVLTRVSIAIFGLGYTYVFLLDKAQYNNHYYLISLLCLLLLVVRANRWGSLDRRWSGAPAVVPFWNLFLLRAQIVLVYFYAGIAKLNADWLGGEPMRTWLAERADYPIVGPLIGSEAAVWFFSWGGALFDLSIGFLLLSRRTLPIAFVAILLFNTTNYFLFDIGVFTFLMIAATMLFDEPDLPRRLFAQPAPPLVAEPQDRRPSHRRLVVGLLAAYLVVQALLPFRHVLYPGNVSWTEEGHRFSWHMKLRSKRGLLKVFVTDPATGRTWRVLPTDDLLPRQVGKMSTRPDMVYDYVQFLRRRLEAEGVRDPIIKVDARMSLNRRPFQHAIDPAVDLAAEPRRVLSAAPWIVPLDERAAPGTLPLTPDDVVRGE